MMLMLMVLFGIVVWRGFKIGQIAEQPAHADVLRVCTERGHDYHHASFTCYAHGSADGAPSPGTTHSAPH